MNFSVEISYFFRFCGFYFEISQKARLIRTLVWSNSKLIRDESPPYKVVKVKTNNKCFYRMQNVCNLLSQMWKFSNIDNMFNKIKLNKLCWSCTCWFHFFFVAFFLSISVSVWFAVVMQHLNVCVFNINAHQAKQS